MASNTMEGKYILITTHGKYNRWFIHQRPKRPRNSQIPFLNLFFFFINDPNDRETRKSLFLNLFSLFVFVLHCQNRFTWNIQHSQYRIRSWNPFYFSQSMWSWCTSWSTCSRRERITTWSCCNRTGRRNFYFKHCLKKTNSIYL